MKWTRNLIVALALSAIAVIGVVSPVQAAPITAPDGDIARILADTNAARADNGLPPLVLDDAVTAVAHTWSTIQYRERRMYHNPQYSTQIPPGWNRAAENVASGYSASTVVGAWMNSPGHRANILGDYTTIGIGYVGGYATQVFAKYAPASPAGTVLPQDFSVRSHVAQRGWIAGGGSIGQGLQLEALAVRQRAGKTICLEAHVQNIGWMAPVCTSGPDTEAVVGTTGRSFRLEALRIWSPGNTVTGRGHVSEVGWQPRTISSAPGGPIYLGTTGRSLRLEFADLFQ